MSIFNRLFKKQNTVAYEYGKVSSGTHARRNIKTGIVEFVLWKAGEQGHSTDCWCRFGDGWAEGFKPYKQ
jgi:hypothetical protein